MTKIRCLLSGFLALGAAACGGGGGGGTPAPVTTYPYVTPAVNAQRVSGVTIVDNASNTVALTVQTTVDSVNADGSFVEHQDDPNNESIVVDGATYSIPTETLTVDASGRELSYVFTPAGASPVTCTESPNGVGPQYPVSVGQTWALTFTITCGAGAPVSYTQTGTVVDVESIAVPAGTFSALKLQSTIVWTDPLGTVHTTSLTSWRNVVDGRSVKQIENYSFSVPPAGGHAVSRTTVLQSLS